jgi:hypothetical protein
MLDKQGYMHAHTHKYAILIAFPQQQRFAKAPQCYVIRTLTALLNLTTARTLNQKPGSEPLTPSMVPSYQLKHSKASLDFVAKRVSDVSLNRS